MKYFFAVIFFCLQFNLFSQPLLPLQKNEYKKLTTYTELINFVGETADKNERIKLEYIGESVEGRKIPVLLISKDEFGADDSKLKVLIFAQQHGNEPSGKEGALLLLKKISEGFYDNLFKAIDLAIVPQVNPDGSEKEQRRNASNMDLNRNHLILSEPETIALHKLFNKYLFEATLDVHEYYPYTKSWMDYGYVKNYDVQFGTVTNPNVDERIRKASTLSFIPLINNFMKTKGYTFNNYILGGPPGVERLRHSTFDINDGRQSFGILNTYSFILEGLNGKDSLSQNIKRRAESQAEAMAGFLTIAEQYKDNVKCLVEIARNHLISSSEDTTIIRMEHVKGDAPFQLVLKSVNTKEDTTIIIWDDYHSGYKKILEAKKPLGYLIEKNIAEKYSFINWLDKHGIIYGSLKDYEISFQDSILLEELYIPDIQLEKKNASGEENIFIPTNQLHGNMLVLALEPQSMLGLYLYDEFKWLLSEEKYPIKRVEKISNN